MSSTHDIPRAAAPPPLPRDPRTITDFSDFIDSLGEEARGFVHAERDYLTLLLAKRSADVSRTLLGAIVGVVLGVCVLLFLSIAGALAIGQALANNALGFLIMAGAYVLIFGLFMWIWRSGVGDRFRLTVINLLHGH